jgi:hypothetical protein
MDSILLLGYLEKLLHSYTLGHLTETDSCQVLNSMGDLPPKRL